MVKEGPALHLYNKDEKVRIGLWIVKNGPALALYDEGERLGAGLGVTEEGFALFLFDRGKPKAALAVLNGEGCISLYNNWGNLKFSK